MKNKKPSLMFYPFVRRWVEKFSLVLNDTYTEAGYVACPKLDRFPVDFCFTFDDVEGDIERLNSIYGTLFDKDFLEDKFPGHASLSKLIGQSREIREESEALSGIGIGNEDRGVYIGGLTLPKRGILYIESNRLDENWKIRYKERKMRPELLKCVSFIPISKKYLPRF